MKELSKYIILFIISIIIIIFIYFLNDIIVDLRVKEIEKILLQVNKEDTDLGHSELVFKYRMNMNLYRKKISIEKVDSFDFDLSLLKRYESRENESVHEKDMYHYLSMPAVKIINLIRFIVGKKAIDALFEENNIPEFEIAYYYERNLKYEKAINFYEKARVKLKEINTAKNIQGSILLHKGFCYSMADDLLKAKKNYMEVIKKYPSKKIATTASILLQYLLEIKKERDIVLKEKNSFEKMEKLYYLFAFKDSLDVLSKISPEIRQKYIPKIKYIEARCFEELDRKQEALIEYQKILYNNARSPYSKFSNRRIYLMGETSKKNAFLKKVAVKNNIILKDPIIQNAIMNRKGIVGNDKKTEDRFSLSPESLNKIKNEKKIKEILISKVKIDSKKEPGIERKKSNGKIYKFIMITGEHITGEIIKEDHVFVYLKTDFGPAKLKKKEIKKRDLSK